MGINSSVLRAKTIKSPEIKHENPIKTPKKNQGIQKKPIKTPKTKHEKPIKSSKTNKGILKRPYGPPLYLYCGNIQKYPLEFSNACLVEIDTTSLKIDDYYFLCSFYRTCRNYRGVGCFYPNPETYAPRVLKGEYLPEDMDANLHVTTAINQFNNLTQKGKLKLETVINSACYGLDCDNFFYIMFYAMDMESNTQSIYQVGMAELGGQPLLGLLRNYLNEKILAVISLKGTNYNSAVKKKKFVSTVTTGSSTL